MDTDWRGIRDRTTYSSERFTPEVPDVVNRTEAYGESKQRVVEDASSRVQAAKAGEMALW